MPTTNLPDSIARLNLRSREQIQTYLDNMRDGSYTLAALCLSAHRSVHMNHDDAGERLAECLGKLCELTSLANGICREMNK